MRCASFIVTSRSDTEGVSSSADSDAFAFAGWVVNDQQARVKLRGIVVAANLNITRRIARLHDGTAADEEAGEFDSFLQ